MITFVSIFLFLLFFCLLLVFNCFVLIFFLFFTAGIWVDMVFFIIFDGNWAVMLRSRFFSIAYSGSC